MQFDVREISRPAVDLIELIRRIGKDHRRIVLRILRVLRVADAATWAGVHEGFARRGIHVRRIRLMPVFACRNISRRGTGKAVELLNRLHEELLRLFLLLQLLLDALDLGGKGVNRAFGIVVAFLFELGHLILKVRELVLELLGLCVLALLVEVIKDTLLLGNLLFDRLPVRRFCRSRKRGNGQRGKGQKDAKRKGFKACLFHHDSLLLLFLVCLNMLMGSLSGFLPDRFRLYPCWKHRPCPFHSGNPRYRAQAGWQRSAACLHS